MGIAVLCKIKTRHSWWSERRVLSEMTLKVIAILTVQVL